MMHSFCYTIILHLYPKSMLIFNSCYVSPDSVQIITGYVFFCPLSANLKYHVIISVTKDSQ